MILRQSITQQLIGDMRVDFGSAHAGMAEHLLYGKQVGTAFQKMGGEAVPEGVRADDLGDTIFLSQVLDNQENHLSGEASSSAVEEYRVGEFGFGRDVQSGAFNVLKQDFQTAVADGHKSFFAALADDTEKTIVTVDVADLQPCEF